MGGLCVKEDKDFNNVVECDPSFKVVNVRAEICSSWGYSSKIDNINLLAIEMKNRGVNLKLKCKPMTGGNGEYYIYRSDGEKEQLVFSNNAEKHKSEGAVIGYNIKSTNVGQIADLLM